MSEIWFGSDWHIGHQKIASFGGRESLVPHGAPEGEHRAKLRAHYQKVVTKRDIVYFLGDMVFTMEGMSFFDGLVGKKILIRGNHDRLDTQVYQKVFSSIEGLLKYKEFWLSHCPIHPDELRGRVNLHGHVHNNTIQINTPGWGIFRKPGPDPRYFNCCPENLMPLVGRPLINIQELRQHLSETS